MIALRPLRSATPRGAVAWPTSTLGCSLARVSASSMRVQVVMSCSARSGTIAELRCGCTWSSTPTGVPRSSGAFTGRRGEGDCSRRETLRGGALYRGGGGLGTAGCTWSLRVRAAWHAPDGWSAGSGGSGDGHSPPMAGEATGAGIVPYPNSDGQDPGTRPARLSLRKGRPVACGFGAAVWSAASASSPTRMPWDAQPHWHWTTVARRATIGGRVRNGQLLRTHRFRATTRAA
jgi:hypothetical protein